MCHKNGLIPHFASPIRRQKKNEIKLIGDFISLFRIIIVSERVISSHKGCVPIYLLLQSINWTHEL